MCVRVRVYVRLHSLVVNDLTVECLSYVGGVNHYVLENRFYLLSGVIFPVCFWKISVCMETRVYPELLW